METEKDIMLYTPLPTGTTSYQAMIISYGSHPISEELSICYAISAETLIYRG